MLNDKGITAFPEKSSNESGQNHLLLIAVNEYRRYEPLHNCVSDLEKLRDVLVRHYEFELENVKPLFNEKATRREILKALLTYAPKPDDEENCLQENQNLFIVFSGHGFHDKEDGGYYWVTALQPFAAPVEDDQLAGDELLRYVNKIRETKSPLS
ncbi:MAG: caspase family protein [Bacteroidota bacterium]